MTKVISLSLFVCCLWGTLRQNICTKFLNSPESVKYTFNSCYGGSRYYFYLVCVSSSSSVVTLFPSECNNDTGIEKHFVNINIHMTLQHCCILQVVLREAARLTKCAFISYMWIFPNSVFIVRTYGSVFIDTVTNGSCLVEWATGGRISDTSLVCSSMFDEV